MTSAITSADSTFEVEFSWGLESSVPRFYTAAKDKKKLRISFKKKNLFLIKKAISTDREKAQV